MNEHDLDQPSTTPEPEAQFGPSLEAQMDFGEQSAPTETECNTQEIPPQNAGPAASEDGPYGPQSGPFPGGQGYYNPGYSPWQGQGVGYGQRPGYSPNQWGNQWQGNQWQQGPGRPPQGGYYNPGYQQWSPGGAPIGDGPEKKKKKKGRGFIRAISALLVITLVSFSVYGIYVAATGDNPLAPLPGQSSGPEGANSVPDISLSKKPSVGGGELQSGDTLSPSQVYAKVSPSVVGVVSYMGSGIYGEQQQGSGIIMTSDGYIITNAHVVEGATRVEIVLPGGDSYNAVVVGSDVRSDLAVLKALEAKDLVPAEFGDSDELTVGERVCAIGNPSGLALQSSLTVGYVSALGRMVASSGSGYALECIQTDAAINPGNSGGALINEYGQVIGINSIKVIDVDYEGIGFAIPITGAMPIITDLIANGKVTGRPMLGITSIPVTAYEAQAYSIPLGLWVKGLNEGADIAAKGVKIDDIITQINDTPIYSVSDCAEILKAFSPGDTVTLTVYRQEGAVRNQTFRVDIILMSS